MGATHPPDRADRHFSNHRDAALSVLNAGIRLTVKAGRFLGQIAVDPNPLSERQAEWLDHLLERAGLPPMRNATP